MKHLKQAFKQQKNENGFTLISTVLILAILTFIGIAATKTAVFELKIAGNEKQANQKFYTADSGWKQSGPFLNAKATAPSFINLTLNNSDPDYQIIRNFGDGDGATVTLNDDFPGGSEDGTITNIPYWYRVIYQTDSQAIQFGADYRDFQYGVECSADSKAEVIIRVKKIFRVGY
jgi:Tfp pilus assembly protein PilX